MQKNLSGSLTEERLRESVLDVVRMIGTPNTKYKDSVFRMLISDKRVALEIYNAMNHTSYDNPEEIIMTTLENAVYMGIKNDVSFIIDARLMLYEHQSTLNPNMPLRDLFYVVCIYAALVREKNIYKNHLLTIPAPKFVVFYNGKEKAPEHWRMRLSDAYERKEEEPSLELIVDAFNINPSFNSGLMAQSPTLYQYVQFVDMVRCHEKSFPFDIAIEKAIDECIAKDILKEFLEKNRAEVMHMWLFEYDQEKHIRMEKEDSWEEGHARGLAEGETMGRVEGFIEAALDLGLSTENILTRLKEKLNLSDTEAQEYMEKYAKQR